MKSKIKKEIKQKEFPCMKKANGGLVVFFYKNECGIAIKENAMHPLGEYRSDWNMEHFVPFFGTIEFSNI